MIDALDPLAPYLFGVIMAWYAVAFTIRRALLIVRRWKNEERDGEHREVEISLWPEKKRLVGGPTINDLEGSKGQLWGEAAKNGSRGSATRSPEQQLAGLVGDPTPPTIGRRGSPELMMVEEFHRKCVYVAARIASRRLAGTMTEPDGRGDDGDSGTGWGRSGQYLPKRLLARNR